jgi:Aspartyl/Asparaginyl beta-hydroxylase
MNTKKLFWLREELHVADELMEAAPMLREEFLAYHTDYIDGDFSKSIPYNNPVEDISGLQTKKDAWRVDPLKYNWKKHNVSIDPLADQTIRDRYPTATKLLEKYKEHCPICTYSSIEPGLVIKRHIGGENEAGDIVRIHVPLIVPEGDIFLEVEGYEIDWSDIYGFDNRYTHSAHNYTDKRRLVLLIDISREYLRLPPAEYFDSAHRAKHWPPFFRGHFPKVYHANQIKNNMATVNSSKGV